MDPSRRNNPNNNGVNPNITAIIAQQLQTIIPQIVTQVTNNINNANGNGGNGNDGNGNGRNGNGGNNKGCTYKEFLVCKPREFDGKGGVIALTRWIKKIESVMDISGCVNNQKVKVRVLEPLVGANHAVYTDRFHELAKLVPHLVTLESKHVERALTDEEVRRGTLSKSSEKRKEVQGDSLFTIYLIPFGHVSFDVIMGMDWLSKHKPEIVFHEKVLRIPLASGKLLRVQGEQTKESSKSMKGTKSNEPKLGDILIVQDFPESKEDHEVHRKLVLELINKEKLFAKFFKCEFWLQEVHFLRHIVNDKGIYVDPSKIEAVKNWKAPKSPSDIQSFLGLAGYYRRFIMNFSKISKPLTLLTQKNQKYEWGVEQEEAFQTLKDNLCNAPILTLPDGPNDFVVYCDASNQGFACVLIQRGKMVAYTSRQLKIHEKNLLEMVI
ncbi:putative reverse transcriptase domain-containing protein [Tanacetum coccineum]